MGTIEKTCAVMSSLIRGATHNRRSLARDFGITVAAADRYIGHLRIIPGVVIAKKGRQLLISFSFGVALKAIGL